MIRVSKAYAHAKKRLLLLDYDGTLVDFNDDPMGATPPPRLLKILADLAHDPANTVVVISGRPATTLEAWLGHIPLGFSAEHGFLHKKPGAKWHTITAVDDNWKAPIREIMDHYASQTPGTSVEEKVSALTWHWRAARDSKNAAKSEQALLAALEAKAKPMHLRILRIIRGNKVIEVHPLGFDKGTGGNYWCGQAAYDFMLAAGDDTTDEDLFEAMPIGSFTVKVRPGETLARLQLADSTAMQDLLETLLTSSKS